MAKKDSGSDQYNNNNKNENNLPFSESSLINTSNVFFRALSSSKQFNLNLCNAFSQAYPIYLGTIYEYKKSWKDLSELDKLLRNRFRKVFDEKFREESFVNTLSNAIASYSELAKITGLGKIYQ